MKRNEKNLDEMLDRHLSLFKAPSRKEPSAAKQVILDRLQSQVGNPLAEKASVDVRAVRLWGTRRSYLRVAAAVFVLGVLTLLGLRDAAVDAHAVVKSADGSLFRVAEGRDQIIRKGERIDAGEILHVNNAGARIVLADSSHVELRAESEFSLERANDGVRVNLSRGGVIVSASKQRTGHLYVQTKDVTVSVVGTVFLVNAEEEGSRVAVIEGEVRVQQGSTTKNLLPGEQLSTIPSRERLPVKEEISWSESASVHIALMQQAKAAAAPARLEFAVASIRPIPANETVPGTVGGLRGSGLGLACHGTDGVQRVLLTFTNAGQASVTAPQGRCVGRGVFLSTLIEFAYGIPSRNVSGGPDWARTNPFITFDEDRRGADVLRASAYTGADGFKWIDVPSFQIEAAADDPATATLAQLRQMVQTMLMERFKLKSSRAGTVVPGYALVVGGKGTKLKSVSGDTEESLVPHKGRSTVEKLAQTLSRMIDAPVVDKSSLTGTFEYEFRRYDPVGGVIPGRMGGPTSEAERAELLSLRLEDQLGLRLVPEKAVPAEIFVIESVELPTPN